MVDQVIDLPKGLHDASTLAELFAEVPLSLHPSLSLSLSLFLSLFIYLNPEGEVSHLVKADS